MVYNDSVETAENVNVDFIESDAFFLLEKRMILITLLICALFAQKIIFFISQFCQMLNLVNTLLFSKLMKRM